MKLKWLTLLLPFKAGFTSISVSQILSRISGVNGYWLASPNFLCREYLHNTELGKTMQLQITEIGSESQHRGCRLKKLVFCCVSYALTISSAKQRHRIPILFSFCPMIRHNGDKYTDTTRKNAWRRIKKHNTYRQNAGPKKVHMWIRMLLSLIGYLWTIKHWIKNDSGYRSTWNYQPKCIPPQRVHDLSDVAWPHSSPHRHVANLSERDAWSEKWPGSPFSAN